MTLHDYLRDPCGVLSIPWWKSKRVKVPPHMRIVHHRDFDEACLGEFADEPYFRLHHSLKDIGTAGNGRYVCVTAREADIPLMADIINRSYTDLSVTVEQLTQYRRTEAFDEALWIIACDAETSETVGCGMADFDPEAGEGALEWIQVLPECRGQKAGQFIVNELLCRLAVRADFVTVSGKVNHPSRPEMLYRKCGFTGGDVWHILTRK